MQNTVKSVLLSGEMNGKHTQTDDLTSPGQGWSNGDVKPQMFSFTREGKLQLYSSQRRWLHLAHGWSRIGEETGSDGKQATQFSRRVSFSNKGTSIIENTDSEAITVRSLIAQLCEQFYKNGWATGTGGGVCIRVGGPQENRPWRVFVAPSGIQKEDMIGDDVFELDMDRNVVVPPRTQNLRQSACTPLWYVVFKSRPSVKSVIHSHSMFAQLATLLDPTESSDCLRITHLEMLKGVGHHAYDDVLEVPIIDNRPTEDLLADQLEKAIAKYPKANAVLVRRHGVYVWGDSWEQAKTQCEAFDYLFESVMELRKIGIDCTQVPRHGTYRVNDEDEPLSKRQKTGFNGVGKVDNALDLASNLTPILPRDAKHLLLDIEGCTTSISFVKDALFPFVLERLDAFLDALDPTDFNALAESLRADLTPAQVPEINDTKDCASMVQYMVKNDLKVASLKALQGRIWKDGYERGDLKGHVFSDLIPMLQWMKSHGVKVHVYSSGSVQAQKLLFGFSIHGDLNGFFDKYFDIATSGNKKQVTSYSKIAMDLGVRPSEIVFCSDDEAELRAAREAGIGNAIMSIRPGNEPMSSLGRKDYPQIFSLLQLCGK